MYNVILDQKGTTFFRKSMSILNRILIFIFIFTATTVAEVDRLFLVQDRFYSSALKSLANAGIAHPTDLFSGQVNPALTFSHHHTVAPQSQGTVAIGYGRDSIFDAHILPTGFSYSNEEGSLGLFYRFIKGKKNILQHEMTINLAGQIFSNSDDQGAVDFGMNLRFEKMMWKKRSAWVQQFLAADSGKWILEKEYESIFPDHDYSLRDKRALLDIGFFQPHILENMDFGLVIKNLLGYVWSYGNQDTIYYDTLTDSQGRDSVMIKASGFTDSRRSMRGWTKGVNRTLTAGIVYHASIGSDKILLNFPLDLEMRGLFNKKIRNRYIFRGGLEAEIARHVMLRFGYARAPGRLRSTWEEIKNINIFTGGAGLKISSFSFDFYASDKVFGLSGSFNY